MTHTMHKCIMALASCALMTIAACNAREAAPTPTTVQHRPPSAESTTSAANENSSEKDTADMHADKPKHTNRLIHATSPYLLQHAHNPVDWYPWGSEAIERARKEDKPIFLSIGYAACHWCHVMEHESFENEATAALLNRDFVCIKVDREERPDLDDIYMKATQLYNQGGGGWPMSVFLTPDLKPFFAGTYFPPEARHGRIGFPDLLTQIADVWKSRRADIEKSATALTDGIAQISRVEGGSELIPESAIDNAAVALANSFDPRRGGINGGGNKFPPSMAMDVLLRAYQRSQESGEPNERFLKLVNVTLTHMANGGIYDQLAGGIARYSTDPEWLAPHFEKMLYDQALVSSIYLDAYQVTKDPLYARIAGEILDYVIGDLQSPQGGYYCTRDADSEGEEGKYYVWSLAEVTQHLGDDAAVFCDYYDVSQHGNWEEKNILRVEQSAADVAAKHNLSVDALNELLARGRTKLLAVRAQRVPPMRDDKVLAAWNGLMIASMAKGAAILHQPRYLASAERAADFVLKTMRRDDGRLLRTWREGQTHTLAYLEDYAFFIEGLLNLHDVTGDFRWVEAADTLNGQLHEHFADPAGGYFFTPDDGEQLIVRNKDSSDGAIPSGNSVHLMNLLRLSILLDDREAEKNAESLMKCFAPRVKQHVHSSERLICAADFYHRRPREVVLVAGKNADGMEEMQRALWSLYLPNKVVAQLTGKAGDATAIQRMPLLADKSPLEGRTTAYVCRNFACKQPTCDVAEFKQLLTAP